MTRTAARFRLNERRLIGGEDAGRSVKLVDEQLVHSEIGDDGVLVVGRDVDGVRMGLGLKRWILPPADVLHEGGLLADGAVVLDAKDGDATASKVGEHKIMAALIDR